MASKEEIWSINSINTEFPLNRAYSKGVKVAEHRRINVDKTTQKDLKLKSKGWKAVPMLTSEYVRSGMDDLHDCTVHKLGKVRDQDHG